MEPYLRRDQASSGLSAPASSASKALFPAGDGGNTVAEMARRDLDAALQLLANRAQYITGATGAAIALRRDGKNDMLCRASTGSTAPELGALLSTEFGLSGESVRTRQALRCDDAERDVRVNREVCRQLGIASVVVMPVVNDDGVLGVFELFSGQVNAFGERDLSAVQRLSEMVETAVRLAEASEHLPERLKAAELSVPAIDTGEAEEDGVLEGPELVAGDLLAEALNLDDLVLDEVFVKEPESGPSVYSPAIEALAKPLAGGTQEHLTQSPTLPQAEQVGVTMGAVVAAPADSKSVVAEKASAPPELKTLIAENAVPAPTEPTPVIAGSIVPGPVEAKAAAPENAAAAMDAPKAITPETISLPALPAAQIGPAPLETAPTKKPTFWSAAPNSVGETGPAEEADRSHVPPGLRGLRKCEACGFPISAGRVLCVECEEKKWRGQLRVPPGGGARQAATVSAAPAALPREARAFAAAQTAAASGAASLPRGASVSAAGDPAPVAVNEASAVTARPAVAVRGASASALPEPSKPEQTGKSSSDFVFSAGIATSQSWFSANKYVMAAVLLVAAIAAVAVLLLR